MDGDDGLAGTGRAGDARRPRKRALNQRALRGVEEDTPFLPGKGEGPLQFLLVGDRPDPPERVRMGEGVGGRRSRGCRQNAGGGVFEQGLRRLGRQMGGQREEIVLGGSAGVGQPVGGDADREQRFVAQGGKQHWRGLILVLSRPWDDFLDTLAHLDDLDRAGARMRFDPASFRPGIGGVVMADIGDQQAFTGPVEDQADVAADAR